VKTVIIADNHPLFRSGVRQLIDASAEFDLVDEAGDSESCLFKVAQHQPYLLLLDLNMPQTGGFDVVRQLRAGHSKCRIVILSMYASREFVETARQLGCDGFVAKEDAGTELIFAIENLDAGFQMTSSVGRGEAPTVASRQTSRPHMPADLTLTELRVLNAIAQSATTQEIAGDMGISPRTVDTHRQNILRKLELSGSNALVRYAVENKDIIAAWQSR